MENSATKALSFPNWAKLRRDKENYPDWRSHIIDLLQAMGCDQAIRDDFLRLTFNSDDDSSSDDDSDGIDLSRLGLQAKHSPQSSPTSSQEHVELKPHICVTKRPDQCCRTNQWPKCGI